MKEIAEHTERLMIQGARSDALRLTKLHLEGFRAQEQYVKNLEEDIEDRYETATKMVTTYGERIGHSSIVKLEGGAKLAENEDHQQQCKEYTQAKHLAERIGRAVEGLPRAERIIMLKRYINQTQEPWINISEKIGYAESACYKLHNRGLRSVAINLFGLQEVIKAEEEKRARRSMV